MDRITRAQVEELIMRLPETKLPRAYKLLATLAESETDTLSPQLEFVLLPVAERQRILAQQAQEMVSHYEQTATEREDWQAGDFVDAQRGYAETCATW